MLTIRKQQLVLVFAFISLSVFSENNFLTDKLTLKVGVETIKREPHYDNNFQTMYHLPDPGIQLDLNYKINKYFSGGIYASYSTVEHWIEMQQISENFYALYKPDGTVFCSGSRNNYFIDSNTILYGINANLSLLPFIVKQKKSRFDLYLSGKFGMVSARWEIFDGIDNYIHVWNKPVLEYGAGLGCSYNFTKRLGIYSEYFWGNFYNSASNKTQIGISYKL